MKIEIELAQLCITHLDNICRCSEDYKQRKLKDPSCEYCDIGCNILPLVNKILNQHKRGFNEAK